MYFINFYELTLSI